MVKKERKAEIVDLLEEKLARANVAIATDYRGLTVSQISQLRQKLREQEIEYRVVNNTLAGFAAAKVGKSGLSPLLKGPTALAFGYGDLLQPAKTLIEYQRSSDTPMTIKGGILGDRFLTADEVLALAKLPPYHELIAKLAGLLQSPISQLLTVLSGNLQGLARILNARMRQLEGGQDA